jgi:hypothetical protein
MQTFVGLDIRMTRAGLLGREYPARHSARQNEGPLGHLATPPARPRDLWPASWPPRPPERRSRKREHNSHFSPLRKPLLGCERDGGQQGLAAGRIREPATDQHG